MSSIELSEQIASRFSVKPELREKRAITVQGDAAEMPTAFGMVTARRTNTDGRDHFIVAFPGKEVEDGGQGLKGYGVSVAYVGENRLLGALSARFNLEEKVAEKK